MTADAIKIEYNEGLQSLADLLGGVRRRGDFQVHGRMELPMPRIEVEGVGVLSFPVLPVQIEALIAQATRAPYGRGEETLLDESVRKVWQLPASGVRVGGKSWAAGFETILQQVREGLGCVGQPVSAELYKLLVYDPGGFFQAHRDTEKSGGMIGTLVLPCVHEGGELWIRHHGREVRVDLSSLEVSEVGYAGFYADCEHEVRPVTTGHRVCLIYNLVQGHQAEGGESALTAPDYEREVLAAATLIEGALKEPGGPAKIAWVLEHQYSPEGLRFSGLKAVDAARVGVLVRAGERAGCVAHLALVHIEECGAAEPHYESSRYRGWGCGYARAEEVIPARFEVIEVAEHRQFLDEWRGLRGEPVAFGELPLDPGELLPAGALDGVPPDVQRLKEATGNEGASFERSYHRAVLVLWRTDRYAEVVTQDYDGSEDAALVEALAWLGSGAAGRLLAGLIENRFPVKYPDCARLLAAVQSHPALGRQPAARKALVPVAKALVEGLGHIGKQPPGPLPFWPGRSGAAPEVTAAFVVEALRGVPAGPEW